MTMRAASRFVRNYQMSKPEMILRSIPRNFDNNVFLEKYKTFLTSIKDDPLLLNDMRLNFSRINFSRFSNNEIKHLVDDSFKIYKEKNFLNPLYYNIYMRNCIDNLIDFNVTEVIQSMNDNKISFNHATYEILIEVLSERGEMAAVENLLEAMKTGNIVISYSSKMKIISGYIIAGQFEKSKAYIEENKLDENSIDVLIYEGNGYASLGDIDNVMNVLTKIKELSLLVSKCVFHFYSRLVKSNNVSDSKLQQIFDMLSINKSVDIVYDTIFRLNRCGFYNHSLKLVGKFESNIKIGPRSRLVDLVMSFKANDCPINTYKKLLKVLWHCLDVDLHNNLFSNMEFAEAFKFAQSEFRQETGKIVSTSLLSKAINDKSTEAINASLQLCMARLPMNLLNLVLNYGFIPSMLRSGMVSNCSQIFDLLPQNKNVLLPAVLIYLLSKGNLVEYDTLLSSQGVLQTMYYSMFWKPIATEIVCNYSFSEINRLVVAVSKAFNETVINNILENVIIEKIILSSKSDDIYGIKAGMKLAEDFNVMFLNSNIERLLNEANKDIEHFKPLFKKIIEKKVEIQ